MDNAKQHWKILQELENDLANRVRSFMVTRWNGVGVMVATENGELYWFRKIRFEDGKTDTELTALDVPGVVVQMAHGHRHILFLNKRGEIFSMGQNYFGQMGLETKDNEDHFSPQLISIPHKFISVRCGYEHSLALTEDGKVWAWGGNDYGQVGMPPSTETIPPPRQIPELDPHRVVAVECGASHSLALTDQGEVYAWGRNHCGQLGDGSTTGKHIPTRIPTLIQFKDMAAGYNHTLLLTRTGEVWACGFNKNGQLGMPASTESSTSLVKVEGLPSISQIASHPLTRLSIAMSIEQRCFVWGEFRDMTFITTPRELPPFYQIVESPLSLYSRHQYNPRSVSIPETPPGLSSRMSQPPVASTTVSLTDTLSLNSPSTSKN